MEKVESNFNIGLALWQVFIGVLLIAIVYFLIKIAKKILNK